MPCPIICLSINIYLRKRSKTVAIYVELTELQKFCRKYTEHDAVQLILNNRTDLIHTANVVDSAKYEELKKENLQLRTKCAGWERIATNKTDTITDLYSRINKAIGKIENEIKFWDGESADPKPYITEIRKRKADSYKHALEILKSDIEETADRKADDLER